MTATLDVFQSFSTFAVRRSRHCSAGCSIDWLWRLALAGTATNGKCHRIPCSCPPTLVRSDPSTSNPPLAGFPCWIFLYFRPRYNIFLHVLITPFVRFIKCVTFLHDILAHSKSEHLMYMSERSLACFTHGNANVQVYLYTYINSSPNMVSHSTVLTTRFKIIKHYIWRKIYRKLKNINTRG